MDKQNVIKELLSRGIMVTPEVLDKALKNGIDSVVSGGQGAISTVVNNIEKSAASESLKCSASVNEQKREYTVDDAVRANFTRYDTLRKIVLRKTDAVSIKNIGSASSKLCIVGVVREKKDFGFVIEDATGELAVKSEANVSVDDVIGVSGWVRDKVFTAESVIYPDVPINREINLMEGTMLLKTQSSITDAKADVMVTPSSFKGPGKEVITKNPNWIRIERGGKKVHVFVYDAGKKVTRDDVILWLRRRYVEAGGPIPDIDLVLEPVPDIMWIIGNNDPWSENYKGITLISFPTTKSAVVDLKNREVRLV